jgi:two-component system CheB/CheR fusion protein
MISKTARIYRHIGRSRPGELGFLMGQGDAARNRATTGQERAAASTTDLASLGRRLLLETYSPAAILINKRHECLFLFGPTDRYLRIAPGPPTNNLLTMARPGMRTKLRAAIQRALQEKARIVVGGGRGERDGQALAFNIEV